MDQKYKELLDYLLEDKTIQHGMERSEEHTV